jgi:hypothetical protein
MNPSIDKLRAELEDAFRNRAHLYRLMLEELESELGPGAAEAVMARVLERRGREVAAALFAGLPADPVAIGERFLAVSPDGGRMYPHARETGEGRIAIHVQRCPLKDAWIGTGLPASRVAQLCRIAGAFDRGLFEAAGVAFANETWSEGRGGCCRIELTRRTHASDKSD